MSDRTLLKMEIIHHEGSGQYEFVMHHDDADTGVVSILLAQLGFAMGANFVGYVTRPGRPAVKVRYDG